MMELARVFGSELTVLGICEPQGRQKQTFALYLENKAEELRDSLSGKAASVKTVLLSGKAAERILDYLETERFDLIVMFSHSQSGIMRCSLGSTVDEVLRKAGIPLIIVRSKALPEGSHVFSRIMIPLDGSVRSTTILPFIERLAAALPCEVFLVEVVEPGMHVRTVGGLDYVPFKERDIVLTKAAAENHLEQASANLIHTRAKVRCEVRIGDAA